MNKKNTIATVEVEDENNNDLTRWPAGTSMDIILGLVEPKPEGKADTSDNEEEVQSTDTNVGKHDHVVGSSTSDKVEDTSDCEEVPAFVPSLEIILEEPDAERNAGKGRDTCYVIECNYNYFKLFNREVYNLTRHKCLADVQNVPSHHLFINYYKDRPYLVKYTKKLAKCKSQQQHSIQKRLSVSSNMNSQRGSISRLVLSRRDRCNNEHSSQEGSIVNRVNKILISEKTARKGTTKLRLKTMGCMITALFGCTSRQNLSLD